MSSNVDKKTLEDAFQAKAVAEIYGNEVGSMTKLQRAPSKKNKYITFVIGSILLIAAGMAWIGYNLFTSQTAFQQENVTLDVKAPATAASGETVTYKIEYLNNDKNAFSEGGITVTYPEGFTVIETSPAAGNNEKTHWDLGLVKSREQGTIEIKGQLTGKNDEAKTVLATLSYRPIHASKPVELKKGATTTISSSVFQLEIKGPNQVVNGEQAVYRILYKNFSDIENKDKVQVNVHYPDGFVFVQANPMPDEGQATWNAQTLLAQLNSSNSSGAIEITGTVNSAQGSESVLTAQIGFKNNDTFQVDQEQSISTMVASGDLILSVAVNGSKEDGDARFGDTLNLAVTYENRGLNTLSDVTIKANIDGDVIDWSTVKDVNNGSFTAGQVTWTGHEVPGLVQLDPQSKGTIEVSIRLKGGDALQSLHLSGATDSDVNAKIWATASVGNTIGPDGMPLPQSNTQGSKSGTIIYRLATTLSFSSQLRYFDDNQAVIGAGPLPPKVGEITTYHVQWQASNTLHDADAFLVRTTLPSYVMWPGRSKASVGDVSYNSATREVTWRIVKLGAGAGESASFDVQFKARSEDGNKVVPIINESVLSANDTVTNKAIEVRKPTLTTNLDFDPIGKGRGLVTQS